VHTTRRKQTEMAKKRALKQKTITHRFSRNRIRKVGKRLRVGKTKKVIPPNVFSGIFYDSKLTANQNMIHYGLCPDPNMDTEKVKQMVESVPKDKKKILPYHHLLREEEDSIWKHIVTPQEQMFLQELSNKYNRDYKKMAFDVKLNPFQYTPKQLEKKFAKFDKYLQIERERLEQKLMKAQKRAEERQRELEKAIAEATSDEESSPNNNNEDDNDDREEDNGKFSDDIIENYEDSDDDDDDDDVNQEAEE
jgi:hypothetical protein